MSGWIKIYRSISKHWLFTDAERLRAWIIILLEVNHAEKPVMIDGEKLECGRGQSVNSIKTWAKLFGNWSRGRTRTFLSLLQNERMIELEGLRKTTRLTVINYSIYQDEKPTESQQKATNKNVKNVKNEKKDSIGDVKSFFDIHHSVLDTPEFLEAWADWEKYRQEIGHKLTERAIKIQINFLAQQPDPIACINQSIISGYRGFFPVKGKAEKKQPSDVELKFLRGEIG